MLKQIRLQNYKCYRDHIIYFNSMTIAIGRNNAGKSTFVEAIRLLSLASAKYKNSTYFEPPEWTGLSIRHRLIKTSLSSIELDLEKVFYRHNDPPAIITASFSNNSKIQLYIGPNEEVYALMINSDGSLILNKSQALHSDIERICVLPQITPLQKNEKVIRDETIKYNLSSRRMSANFRNQLFLYKDSEEYKNFKDIIENTWTGIKIHDLYSENGELFLQLRDTDFVDEVSIMGHGVQMWLQTMWFLSRVGKNSIVVLDEPDVYMHPDLQRKLIRMLKNAYKQTIIATHSIEIISEVQPKEILIIDRNKKESAFVDSIPALQVILNSIGSAQNIALSRLDRYKKYLYVEGDDIDILKHIYNTLFPDSNLPIDRIPFAATGGWGSWDVKSKDASRLLEVENSYKIYFIYDRDYHTQDEIDERKRIAETKKINICIWSKKEIENYLIVPSSITRCIGYNMQEEKVKPTVEEIELLINNICEELKKNTYECLMEEMLNKNRRLGYKSVKSKVDTYFDSKWETFEGKISLVSGKCFISRMSECCKKSYGVSFGTSVLASVLLQDEIHSDVKNILSAIENCDRYI